MQRGREAVDQVELEAQRERPRVGRDLRAVAVQRAVEGAQALAAVQLDRRPPAVRAGQVDRVPAVAARSEDPARGDERLATVGAVAEVAAERGVALWVSDRTRLPDRLVDPRGLVTVVGNLVDNALDAVAGTPHARVEVELRAEGRTAVLRVRDTGPGIPAEQRELVFTEGWSTKEPPAHRKRGIGLSLVRRLAERQGGSATVGEAAGGGAEFTVVLPEALAGPDLEPAVSVPPGPQTAAEEES